MLSVVKDGILCMITALLKNKFVRPTKALQILTTELFSAKTLIKGVRIPIMSIIIVLAIAVASLFDNAKKILTGKIFFNILLK